MKLKELKCKNCGATLKIEEGITQVNCEFCHTKFAVEDAYHDGYKFEKGRIKAQNEQIEQDMENLNEFMNNNPIGKANKITMIIASIIFVLIFGFALFGIISGFSSAQTSHNEFEIRKFNNSFEMYIGTEYGSSVGWLIDEVVTNNKTNQKRKITLKYKDTETKNPEKIKEVKKQLDEWKEYEVSFEYDEDGYIYLVAIED